MNLTGGEVQVWVPIAWCQAFESRCIGTEMLPAVPKNEEMTEHLP